MLYILCTYYQFKLFICNEHINDPSAGSPTETLLRLLLPLNNRVFKFLITINIFLKNIYLSNLITNVFNR